MSETTSIVHTKEESARIVAQWRAEGLMPPKGKAHEWVKPTDGRVTTTSSRVEPVSDIGDRVKAKFAAIKVTMSKGCSCERVRQEMNALTADEVIGKLDHLTKATFANIMHIEGLIGFAAKSLTAIAPGLARKRIRTVITKACHEWRTTNPRSLAASSPEPSPPLDDIQTELEPAP